MTNELEKQKTSWVTCEWCGDRKLKYPSDKKKTTHNYNSGYGSGITTVKIK